MAKQRHLAKSKGREIILVHIAELIFTRGRGQKESRGELLNMENFINEANFCFGRAVPKRVD